MLKAFVASGLGVIITISILAFMSSLVNLKQQIIPKESFNLNIITQIEPSKSNQITPLTEPINNLIKNISQNLNHLQDLPNSLFTNKDYISQINLPNISNLDTFKADLKLPNMEVNSSSITNSNRNNINIKDISKNAIPIIRVKPIYPINAVRRNIEGWVKLKFNINNDGSVSYVTIIDSNPKRIFDQAAIKAVQKWKYRRPNIEDGQANKQLNIITTVEFKLEQ